VGGLKAAWNRVSEVIPMRRKAYSCQSVKTVRLEKVVVGRGGQAAWVGVDVAKEDMKAVLHWGEKQFERPWNVENPGELRAFVELLAELAVGRKLIVALEPSGTYGDALRQAAADAGLTVHRVSPKAAHDYAEIFDGVPSQHDGKDAAIVAELARQGKSVEWRWERPESVDEQIEYWMDRMDAHRRIYQVWIGRLEGRLARHWPEGGRLLKTGSRSMLEAMAAYGGPQWLAEDEQAGARLQRWSRGYLKPEKLQALLSSAKETLGVRQSDWDRRRMKDIAQSALAVRRERRQAKRRLKALARHRPAILAMGQVVGVATACVLWACLGDPRKYYCAGAYVKAMGLNLVERSSGKWKGRLKISKRGFGLVRYWLYLAALRAVKEEPARSWYEAKRGKDGEKGGRALVAIMRRLGYALHPVSRGLKFDVYRMFGKRRAAVVKGR
jgi:transposase